MPLQFWRAPALECRNAAGATRGVHGACAPLPGPDSLQPHTTMKIAVCLKQVIKRDSALRVDEARAWVRDADA